MEFELTNIDEAHIKTLFERLPGTWRRTKGFSFMGFTLVLAKMWEYEDNIVGFSTWFHGYVTLVCSISYSCSEKSCVVTLESGSADPNIFARTESNRRKFAEAIRASLEVA